MFSRNAFYLALLSLLGECSAQEMPTPKWGAVIRKDHGPLSAGEQSHQDAGYRRLIVVHGTFAALIFLLFMPASIVLTRYFKNVGTMNNGKWVKIHMAMNLFSVLLLIIVFVTGYYAVGADDNVFDNVHHRIGLTIFVGVLLQATIGLLNTFVLYSGPHARTPFQNKMHKLFGWLILGLAMSNIPVGMVLYGSSMALFVLYGIAAGLWIVLVLALEAVKGGVSSNVPARPEEKVNWNGNIIGRREGSGSIDDERKTSV